MFKYYQQCYYTTTSSKRWIARQIRDKYVKKAAQDNFRARSAYKLQELDNKYNLITPNSVIVDCGASPGSWCQYISRKIFPSKNVDVDVNVDNSLIIAVDLLPIDPITGVKIIQGDFTELVTQQKIFDLLNKRHVDVILNDMAPNFTGNHFVDHVRSMELCECSLTFAELVLKPGGTFLCKFLMGESESEFRNKLKSKFKKIRYEKPHSSRNKSTEGYFVCLEFNKNVTDGMT
ncbi:8193_t:CDS:2 [Cetraspora pellucida]|uniref:rRNA methyltransferase 2, mitochondrial n=1 Tax=Cetraspora pellucida TaxID=1433469 RepID=A0A9N9F0Z0_9GLOM|nr:8193_t:CDS:2 [Cetraspora pellucida]